MSMKKPKLSIALPKFNPRETVPLKKMESLKNQLKKNITTNSREAEEHKRSAIRLDVTMGAIPAISPAQQLMH